MQPQCSRFSTLIIAHIRDLILILIWISIALVLVPTTALSFDLSLIQGTAIRMIDLGISPFLFWKFGVPYLVLNIWTYLSHFVFQMMGFSPVASIHIAAKLPLLAASLATAAILRRLAYEYGSSWEQSKVVALAWLFSPIAIWVSCVQYQIEPVTALTILAALYCIKRGKFLSAGLITGIGASVEYVPLLIFVYVMLSVREHNVSIRNGVFYCLSTLFSLSVCFLPNLLSSTGRSGLSLIDKVTATSGGASTPVPIKTRSLWELWHVLGLPNNVVHYWIFVEILVITLILVIYLIKLSPRKPCPRPYSAEVALVMAIIATVILDPASLPQFALLVQTALFILVCIKRLNLLAAIAIPLGGVITWLFDYNAYQFFLDLRPHIYQHIRSLLPVPSQNIATPPSEFNERISIGFGASYYLATIAAVAASVHKNRHTKNTGLKMISACIVVCLLPLMIWTLQPYIIHRVFSSSPDLLMDDIGAVDPINVPLSVRSINRNDSIAVTHNNLVEVINKSKIQPDVTEEFTSQSILSQTAIGGQATHPYGVIDDWAYTKQYISSLWIRTLVHDDIWSQRSSVNRGRLLFPKVFLNGNVTPVYSVSWVVPGWVVVTIRAAATTVSANGVINLVVNGPQGTQVISNASPEGTPYLAVRAASGYFVVGYDGKSRQVQFHANQSGIGSISNLWSGNRIGKSVRIEGLSSSGIRKGDLQTMLTLRASWPLWDIESLRYRSIGELLGCLLIIGSLVTGFFSYAMYERKPNPDRRDLPADC